MKSERALFEHQSRPEVEHVRDLLGRLDAMESEVTTLGHDHDDDGKNGHMELLQATAQELNEKDAEILEYAVEHDGVIPDEQFEEYKDCAFSGQCSFMLFAMVAKKRKLSEEDRKKRFKNVRLEG